MSAIGTIADIVFVVGESAFPPKADIETLASPLG